MSREYYVYLLSNINFKVLYTGVTNDIIRRVYQHKSKLIEGFTKKYNVNRLVYFEIYSDIGHALDREKQIKKWRRQKKNDLINQINPSWKDLYDEIIG